MGVIIKHWAFLIQCKRIPRCKKLSARHNRIPGTVEIIFQHSGNYFSAQWSLLGTTRENLSLAQWKFCLLLELLL